MLYVHVFVGSPNDVASFRAVMLSPIEEMRQNLEVDEIATTGEDWLLVAGDLGEPQSVINPEIAKANLLILMICQRIGEGTRKELDFAWSFPGDGRLQSLMIYFQTMPPAMLAAPSPEARDVIVSERAQLCCVSNRDVPGSQRARRPSRCVKGRQRCRRYPALCGTCPWHDAEPRRNRSSR
jgi:hypothetical protein